MKLVQCWDDGVEDDVRLIEILRKHGAKASFNLNFGLLNQPRSSGWSYRDVKEVFRLPKERIKEVYEGFLVANHSLSHPYLEQIPIHDAVREIHEGKTQLEQHFGYAVKGFSYPFGTYNPAVQEAVREAGHVYARTTLSVPEIFPCADVTTFHPNCHFMDGEFWKKFEHVKAGNGTFYFWGHSYENVTDEDWENLDAKIARLSAEGEWVNLPDLF
jgi:peptidoglycan/xylan/chitin deacetylase (PgdA/CDA1 family)